MSKEPKINITMTQAISMIVCTVLLLIYVTLVVWYLWFMLDWLTLEWLMINLEWVIGVLLFGCFILFFFPILLGWQLKKDGENSEWKMESFNYISILIMIFLMILVGRQIRLEKDVRKLNRLNKHIKSEIDKLKGV